MLIPLITVHLLLANLQTTQAEYHSHSPLTHHHHPHHPHLELKVAATFWSSHKHSSSLRSSQSACLKLWSLSLSFLTSCFYLKQLSSSVYVCAHICVWGGGGRELAHFILSAFTNRKAIFKLNSFETVPTDTDNQLSVKPKLHVKINAKRFLHRSSKEKSMNET